MSFLRLSRRLAAVVGVVAAVATIGVAPAHASSLTVTTTADELNSNGNCSLREAMLAANSDAAVDACPAGQAVPTVDVITFGVTGTITLDAGLGPLPGPCTGGLPPGAVSIIGPGPSSLTVSGGGAVRIFNVGFHCGQLNLSGLTVANGSAFIGGAIDNTGEVTITNSVFSGNSAGNGGGGAIHNNSGTVTVTNSTFSGNSSAGSNALGGAIRNTGTLTIVDTTFAGNAGPRGGAIWNGSTSLTVTGSTFSGNSSNVGGAISNDIGGAVGVANSTFSGNSAGNGGAIYNVASTFTLTNATLSGNSATTGKALYAAFGAFGAVTLRNSIVVNSSGGGNCSGDGVTDGGGNLSWPDVTCPGINQDPVLGPLASNGGPTQTMALTAGSPAIDAAVDANCPSTDQRGVSRPQGPHCDIGAYEFNAITVAIDIQPGEAPNAINLSKNGVITVAVLGTATFNPANVNTATVCFGDAEDLSQRDCTVAPGTVLQDVNKDKIKDLVLHFETQQTGIDPGDTEACLTGNLFNGTAIQGCDSIKTK